MKQILGIIPSDNPVHEECKIFIQWHACELWIPIYGMMEMKIIFNVEMTYFFMIAEKSSMP